MYDQKKIDLIKNVVIYTRVHNLDNGGSEYLEQQEIKCREFAAKMGWNVVDVFSEVSCGMVDEWSRPVFMMAKKLSQSFPKRKNKCILLVASVDKLSKRSYMVCSMMDDRDIQFYSAKDREQQDHLGMQMQSIMAEENWRVKYPTMHENGRIKEESFRNTLGWVLYSKYWMSLMKEHVDRGYSEDSFISDRNTYKRWHEPSWDTSYVEKLKEYSNMY